MFNYWLFVIPFRQILSALFVIAFLMQPFVPRRWVAFSWALGGVGFFIYSLSNWERLTDPVIYDVIGLLGLVVAGLRLSDRRRSAHWLGTFLAWPSLGDALMLEGTTANLFLAALPVLFWSGLTGILNKGGK